MRLLAKRRRRRPRGALPQGHFREKEAGGAGFCEGAVVQFAGFGPTAAIRPGATVIRYGVGYDNIDVAAARAHGLRVGYVPDSCTDEVADHTAAAALALLRKLPQLDASVRRGEWAAVSVC